jgi:D-alanyl-lipoteichoic acid acyltransferase DltB (MBOAT superfamily)
VEYLKDIFTYSSEEPMLFTRLYFWVFFTVLLIFYSFLYKHKALRNAYLFLMSLFFYYKSGGYFFSLLIFSTIADYTLGHLIYRARNPLKKKGYLATSVIINLGVLSYFKYSYFFTDMVNRIFNTDLEVVNLLAKWSNEIAGTGFDIGTIILPVGISFYTFQTISYTVDIYRNKVKPVNNILDFGFYVSFFPQLVAGPIVRAAEFIPQLKQKFQLTYREFSHALFLILSGLLKKMLISDYISINYVDRVFDAPTAYSGFENALAVYGYSLQIYCDFSGYTDIAIGVALLLGFRLPINFNSPYKARSVTEFWHRWHISLSSWLRDYLYIPLGGNRKGELRKNVNLMITMLLGGLWHGAHLRFIIWGGIHGIFLVIHKQWLKISNYLAEKMNLKTFSGHKPLNRFLSVFFTFHVVTIAWIFFRAQDMRRAKLMFNQIFNKFNAGLIPDIVSSYQEVFFIIVGGFILHWLPANFKEKYRGWFIQSPLWVKLIIVVVVVFVIYQVKSSAIQPFIYFKF